MTQGNDSLLKNAVARMVIHAYCTRVGSIAWAAICAGIFRMSLLFSLDLAGCVLS